MPPTESTPLLIGEPDDANGSSSSTVPPTGRRQALFDFLEAKTRAGEIYEQFMIILILANVAAFIVGSLFVTDYNPVDWAQRDGGLCDTLCDTLWFGNYADNYLISFRKYFRHVN